MKPTIQDLHESGRYRLVESFKIEEMMQFLVRELGMSPGKKATDKPVTTPQRLKKAAGFALFMLVSVGFGWLIGTGIARWLPKEALISSGIQFLAGLVAFFPLITVHEFIHGIFFKRVGAPRVGYGWSWKGMMAYAYAQNYVMTLREVAYVAVMPFVFISIALVIAWAVMPQFAVAWATLLFLHTTGCIGDFVLINFWRKNQHRHMFTYDDIDVENRTYYFERVEG
ncbi:metalloprotease family protein [Fibrella aquatica]|uniref:metalloprotease family protein n=1 Tax=Fibrella aquatica TaxID=3242487 RepID=UPI0035219F18